VCVVLRGRVGFVVCEGLGVCVCEGSGGFRGVGGVGEGLSGRACWGGLVWRRCEPQPVATQNRGPKTCTLHASARPQPHQQRHPARARTCSRPGSSPTVLSHSRSCASGSCSQRSSSKLGVRIAGRGRCHAGSNPARVSCPTTDCSRCLSRSRCCCCCCCCCCATSGSVSNLLPLLLVLLRFASARLSASMALLLVPGGSSGSSRLMEARRKLLVPSKLTAELLVFGLFELVRKQSCSQLAAATASLLHTPHAQPPPQLLAQTLTLASTAASTR